MSLPLPLRCFLRRLFRPLRPDEEVDHRLLRPVAVRPVTSPYTPGEANQTAYVINAARITRAAVRTSMGWHFATPHTVAEHGFETTYRPPDHLGCMEHRELGIPGQLA